MAKEEKKETIKKGKVSNKRTKKTVKVAASEKKSVKKETKKDGEKKTKAVKAAKSERSGARYFEAVGRRKTSVARVRLFTQGEREILINGKSYQQYFPILENQLNITAPLEKMKMLDRFRVLVKVKGGGFNSQSEAVRHGIARALLKFNPEFRKKLRKAGFLTRDPRTRERKKFGLKRARRAPQWRKR
ncbi:MAG TPA: 30S ribosomal protein S9 [Candidatus Parcubacteria bacterium]|nr:30S ribosomal protein S9 [Candidatus Parcubacteria bacterium]